MKKMFAPRTKHYKVVARKASVQKGFSSGRCQGKSVYKKKLS